MSMMTSQILKFVDFTKTQKRRYLEIKTLPFLEIKNSLIAHQGIHYSKKYFCIRGDFREGPFWAFPSVSSPEKAHFE